MSSPLTRAAFAASAKRFVSHLRAQGLTIHTATVEDVREAIAILSAGKAPSSAAQYARRVKSLLSYAHRLGYTPFNAGPAIRTKGGAGRQGQAHRDGDRDSAADPVRPDEARSPHA